MSRIIYIYIYIYIIIKMSKNIYIYIYIYIIIKMSRMELNPFLFYYVHSINDDVEVYTDRVHYHYSY